MTRLPASGGSMGPPYTYVQDGYPSDAEEGESLYHITENAAYVYTGTNWIDQTVTDHGQLSGVSEGDHRSDQRVAELAPVSSVNGKTGDVSAGLGFQTLTGSNSTSLSGNTSQSDSDVALDSGEFLYVGSTLQLSAEITGGNAYSDDFAITTATVKVEFEDGSTTAVHSAEAKQDFEGITSRTDESMFGTANGAGVPNRVILDFDYSLDGSSNTSEHIADWTVYVMK